MPNLTRENRIEPTAVDLSWMAQGACRGVDTSIFFPEKNEPALIQKMKQCRAICAECPVLEPCREYALTYERMGFWGGMSEKDRRAYRSKMGAPTQERVFTRVNL